ncbi:hypothetical protein EGK74_03640 [Neisseria weixii]|uniref:Uncharacterized protein n=1 Tax=Neisseria weixii TaxID=1853276 RepID=A0A3N4N2I5_9NEIS|nr:hypothetical protein CGZ65_04365 [Neisseria weixii]RPD89548.1 hypothetical protein EGK74_03640 [Neisseria weixii]
MAQTIKLLKSDFSIKITFVQLLFNLIMPSEMFRRRVYISNIYCHLKEINVAIKTNNRHTEPHT